MSKALDKEGGCHSKSLKAEDHQSCEKPIVVKEFENPAGFVVVTKDSAPFASLLHSHRVFQVKISQRADKSLTCRAKSCLH